MTSLQLRGSFLGRLVSSISTTKPGSTRLGRSNGPLIDSTAPTASGLSLIPKVNPCPPSGVPGCSSAQSHATGSRSITPGTPSQMNVTWIGHTDPGGTTALAEMQMNPVHPGGTGFGAGPSGTSGGPSFTSVADHPGHSPEIDQVAPAPDGELQNVRMWMYELPWPGHTSIVPMCLLTCPPPEGLVHVMSTLPSQWSSGGHPVACVD